MCCTTQPYYCSSYSKGFYFIITVKMKEQRIKNMSWLTIHFHKKKKNQIFIFLAQTKSCSWFPPKTQSQLPYFSMNYKHVVIFFFSWWSRAAVTSWTWQVFKNKLLDKKMKKRKMPTSCDKIHAEAMFSDIFDQRRI